MKGVIVLGSARSNGNTHASVIELQNHLNLDLIDLNDYNILPFDYNFNNRNDDFLPLIEKIINNYDLIVFATPIYLYSMSGLLKNFLDRITDCLYIAKDLGRKLNGKKMAVLSTSSEKKPTEGFYIPFIKSAEYLDMSYITDIHIPFPNDSIRLNLEQKSKIKGLAKKLPSYLK